MASSTCFFNLTPVLLQMLIWLVVLTILKNISQWEGLSHILWEKNVPNHQPDIHAKSQIHRKDKIKATVYSQHNPICDRVNRRCPKTCIWPHGHLSEVHRDTAPRSQFLQYNSPNSANQDAVRTCCRLLSTKIQQRSLQCDASNSFFIECLVGGFNLSEKYESQLGWLFPIWTNKKMFQTTNQFFIKCTWLHRQRIHSPHSTRNQGPPSQNWYLAKHQRLVCAHGSKSTKDLQHWGLKSCHPLKSTSKKTPLVQWIKTPSPRCSNMAENWSVRPKYGSWHVNIGIGASPTHHQSHQILDPSPLFNSKPSDPLVNLWPIFKSLVSNPLVIH